MQRQLNDKNVFYCSSIGNIMRFKLDRIIKFKRIRTYCYYYPHSLIFKSDHFIFDFRQLDEIHVCLISDRSLKIFDQFTRQVLFQLHPNPCPSQLRIVPAPLFDINDYACVMIQENNGSVKVLEVPTEAVREIAGGASGVQVLAESECYYRHGGYDTSSGER